MARWGPQWGRVVHMCCERRRHRILPRTSTTQLVRVPVLHLLPRKPLAALRALLVLARALLVLGLACLFRTIVRFVSCPHPLTTNHMYSRTLPAERRKLLPWPSSPWLALFSSIIVTFLAGPFLVAVLLRGHVGAQVCGAIIGCNPLVAGTFAAAHVLSWSSNLL